MLGGEGIAMLAGEVLGQVPAVAQRVEFALNLVERPALGNQSAGVRVNDVVETVVNSLRVAATRLR
jgi:hypothetical protein